MTVPPRLVETERMHIHDVWQRIEQYAGSEFKTVTGLPFIYRVPGQFVRVTRDGQEINRSLSRTTFANALRDMPVSNPGQLKDVQGSAYVWGILMDPRIRQSDW